MGKKYTYTVLFILFFISIIPAQESKYIKDILTFHLLDVESGLSHNFVNDIEQDSLGFIWIATLEGLNRYDGTNFIKFKKENTKNGIINNHINTLRVDENGKLIIATDKGVNIYNPKKETFEIFKHNNKPLKTHVSSLEISPNNQLIVGSARKKWGLSFKDKNGNLKFINHQSHNLSSLSSNYVSSLCVQGDSILWIGTNNFGLNKYNYKNKKITRVSLGNNLNDSSLTIETFYLDSKGNLWMGTSNGLFVITKNGDTLKLKKSLIPNRGLSDNDILALEEDNQNKMWIGTRNGGLNILDISSFLLNKKLNIKWYLPKSDGSSVFNRTVSSIKKDSDGNMWLGTSTGVNFVNPRGEPIKLFKKNIDNPHGINHNRIGAFAQKSDGKIWVGTDGAGLNLFDPNTGKFLSYRHNYKNSKSLSNDYIISLYEDTKKRVWVGTYGGGINKMDSKTGLNKHYLQHSIENGSDVRKIFEDKKGLIWVGTNRGGLYKYSETDDKFEYVKSLGKIDIRDIINDNSDNLWLATYGDGILKYNPVNDTYIQYNMNNTKGMTSNVVFCLLHLNNGEILSGLRYGGLIKINPKTKTAISFTEKDGLSNNTVSSIVMEDETNVWLGTFNGISHFNTATNKVENLNTFNNIQRSEFNIGAVLKDKNGYIYFGGNKGFNMFNPKNLKNNFTKSYKIVFENIQVLNKKINVTPSDKNAILKEAISYQDKITLKHNQNFLSIDFAVLKYPVAKNIQYSYILEGYHKNWIDNKSSGKANLSNIPAGKYYLKVKAKLDSGKEVFGKLSVNIIPPFWNTPVFYTICILLLMTAIYFALKYYSDHIKLKNSLLFEKKQRQLEQDFNKERIRFFINFSHELRTPLTLILGPIDDLLNELTNKRHLEKLDLMKKNGTYLSQSINKLLEFRKSEVGLSDLIIGEYNISDVLKRIVDNYLLMTQKQGINLTYSSSDKNLMVWFDIEKIQIIINNLLSNAIKACKEKDNINIHLSTDEQYFKITIKDSGSGIHPEDFDHIFEWYYQSKSLPRKKGSGIGLALSNNLAVLHKGKINVESKLNEGATFTVYIPRDKSLFEATTVKKVQKNLNPGLETATPDALRSPSLLIPEDKKKLNVHLGEEMLLILIIDDNPDILKYLEGILDKNYDLIYAENGEKGIEKAIKYVPDLIISDIMMPVKSGIDLCNNLKNNTTTAHIPIILLSAKNNIESIKEGYETGADEYVVKPFNSQLLLTRIDNLISNRKSLSKYFTEQNEPLASFPLEHTKLIEKEKEFLRRLETIILKKLKEGKANVKEITNEIGMSRTPLFRKIKAITGGNINDYITTVKLKKAATLIKNEEYSISQAAFEVGYNSPKYFRKLFKEQFGIVPSKYKNNID
ncbi:hybrid sensor histidine kinase/response regulator [Polaribacter reichenbachii]|uniref:histidine kinase n=1 Tax=Polaribacter reichenbachii TaxID=996801 RepID=A0A1B8U637_9FLAO|nr:two-component regulator propeller domain-containing protein [Polaribacter reichenbachii]APZ45931.1 hybrid sensor histidine kinase/response regulator [Polaribacter reichenbachii]AUC19793.1 hybrid sensor histidine kinase/response regulator [Polaribacter reichenbachii]OBY67353.1 hypothetical protein LPB301_03160 [Polaribacter reichenbachii]